MSDLKVIYQDLFDAIAEIDVKLDSLTDAKSAGKRKITNDLVEAQTSLWENNAATVVTQLQALDPIVAAGVYFGLIRAIESGFSETAKTTVDSLVEAAPEAQPLITADEAKELSTVRSDLYKKVKSVVELAAQFGDGDLEMPKTRRGSRGKRGPRALSLFDWSVDGEDYENLRAVALAFGYEAQKDLTAAMRAAEIDTRNPEDRIEFTLPNGKVLVGIRGEDTDDEDDEDTPDSE